MNVLYFDVQKTISAGIRTVAAKLDWEFGFPRVPIIPFVADSHLNMSIPKNCRQE